MNAHVLLLLVGCFMHARRYFMKAFDAKDIRAAEPLDIIRRMYAVERTSRDAGEPHGPRLVRRQKDLVPPLDELEAWLKDNRGGDPSSEPLGRALAYLEDHWEIFRVVEKDGAFEIDNGEPERRIRGRARGRRNWIFAGFDGGAESTAKILTVLETAKSFGIDPREHLHDVLVKIAGDRKQSRLAELLPREWPQREPACRPSSTESGPGEPNSADLRPRDVLRQSDTLRQSSSSPCSLRELQITVAHCEGGSWTSISVLARCLVRRVRRALQALWPARSAVGTHGTVLPSVARDTGLTLPSSCEERSSSALEHT